MSAPEPSPLVEMTWAWLIDLLTATATVEWSYHEDDNRYPRDFWHARVRWCDMVTEWTAYGKQEQRELPKDVEQKAEKQQLDIFRINLKSTIAEAIKIKEGI